MECSFVGASNTMDSHCSVIFFWGGLESTAIAPLIKCEVFVLEHKYFSAIFGAWEHFYK
jgi:hypothetical protein